MADRNIKVGVCDRCNGFYNVPVAVIGFGDNLSGLSLNVRRYFIHLPENIFEDGFLGIVHRGDLLWIVGVGGGFHRIHGQHLRPDGTGAEHLQLIIGEICPCGIDLRLIVGVNFLHSLPHSLPRAAALTGEEDAETRADDQPDQADYDDDGDRDPSTGGDSCG